MDEVKFKAAYNESRNGANYFVRHPLMRSFQYSDGVQELAEAGCYWLLDILATECPQALRGSGEVQGIVEVVASLGKADIYLTVDDARPPIWSRHIALTDMPDGSWQFELVDEGDRVALILLTEH